MKAKDIKPLFAMLSWVCCFAVTLIACSDNEAQPVITSVRATTSNDTFTDANPGQMIVIQGENLDGATAIYINNQSVSFLPTFNTSTHIIVTIPENLPLVGANPSLPAEIRVVTSRGEAVFAFHVNSPTPVITVYEPEYSTAADGSVGVKPGSELKIVGQNFYEVKRVYLCEDEKATTGQEMTFTVAADYCSIRATLPAVLPKNGWLVVECYSGEARYAFSSAVPKPEITHISSLLPIAGSRVVVYGRNLKSVTSIDICGEYTIAAADITESATQDSLSFVLPRVPSSAGVLSVKALGGTVSVPFYQRSTVFCDFDSKFGWWSWGGNEATEVTAKLAPTARDGKFYGVEGEVTDRWWWGNLYFGGFSLPTAIADATPVGNIKVCFECYIAKPLQGTQFNFSFIDDDAGVMKATGSLTITDRVTGKQPVGEWFSAEIPLSSFTSAATYGVMRAAHNGSFHINTRPSEQVLGSTIGVYFDNFRVEVSQ